MKSGYRIKKASAVYTGGSIWLFYGEVGSDYGKHYFLTDDDGCTLILDEDPVDFDKSLWAEWQEEHKVEELCGDARIAFCDMLSDRLLRHNKADDLGGMTDDEIKAYKKWWRIPI